MANSRPAKPVHRAFRGTRIHEDSPTDMIHITQVRSVIGTQRAQRRTLRALGLRRLHHTVPQPDRPEIRGMLAKVAHLIEVRRPGDDEAMDLEPGQQPTSDHEDQT